MIKGRAKVKKFFLLLLAIVIGVFVFKFAARPARQYSLSAINPPKIEAAEPFQNKLYPLDILGIPSIVNQPQTESLKFEFRGEFLDVRPVQSFSLPGSDGVQRQVSEAAFWTGLAFPQTRRLDLMDKMN
jgi:hypothetical protein